MSSTVQAPKVSLADLVSAAFSQATILPLPADTDWSGCHTTGVATMYGEGNGTRDHWGWPDGAWIHVAPPTTIRGHEGWYLPVLFEPREGASTEYGLVFRYVQGGKDRVFAIHFRL